METRYSGRRRRPGKGLERPKIGQISKQFILIPPLLFQNKVRLRANMHPQFANVSNARYRYTHALSTHAFSHPHGLRGVLALLPYRSFEGVIMYRG